MAVETKVMSQMQSDCQNLELINDKSQFNIIDIQSVR